MMMGTERLAAQGRLAEMQQEARRLCLRIESHRDSLRQALDPLARVEELDPDRISGLGLELSSLVIEYRDSHARIRAARTALGL